MGQCLVLKRTAGLGDVLMLLPLARALAERDGASVFIATEKRIKTALEGHPLPGLDGLVDADRLDDFMHRQRAQGNAAAIHDMNHPRHSLQRDHQVNSFLAQFGFDPKQVDRSLGLCRPALVVDMVDFLLDEIPAPPPGGARILIHPAQGAMHRTWPKRLWQSLIKALMAQGHQTLMIGSAATSPGKGSFALTAPPGHDLTGKLGFWETVELMRRADVLVSTDTAPIQMAGATEIGICGLYSITRGKWRLPFRDRGRAVAVEPSCPHFPCYPLMYEPALFEKARAAMLSQGMAEQTLLYEWCPDDFSYDCLESQITVDMVTTSVARLLEAPNS